MVPVALILFGILDFDTSVEHIDFNTLGVLVGMMLFVGVVKGSGIFEYLAIKSAKLVRGNPWLIMLVFSIITALLSALLDNVTTILLIGPVTYTVCKLLLDINPIPFFITEILASNIGGTATLIGDPPNIMIGSAANLSFFDFIIYDAPCVLLIMAAVLAIFYFMYGRKLGVSDDKREAVMHLVEADAIHDRSLFHKSVIMIVIVAAAFVTHGFFHIEPSVIALAAAGIMLVISGADMEKTIREVEWTTIGFFAGLFVVVGGMAETGVIQMMAEGMMELTVATCCSRSLSSFGRARSYPLSLTTSRWWQRSSLSSPRWAPQVSMLLLCGGLFHWVPASAVAVRSSVRLPTLLWPRSRNATAIPFPSWNTRRSASRS